MNFIKLTTKEGDTLLPVFVNLFNLLYFRNNTASGLDWSNGFIVLASGAILNVVETGVEIASLLGDVAVASIDTAAADIAAGTKVGIVTPSR